MPARLAFIGRLTAVLVLLAACETGTSQSASSSWESRGRSAAQGRAGDFTRSFRMEDCTFSTTGNSPFFPLVPGQVSTFKGEVEGDREELVITTNNATINIGGVLPGSWKSTTW